MSKWDPLKGAPIYGEATEGHMSKLLLLGMLGAFAVVVLLVLLKFQPPQPGCPIPTPEASAVISSTCPSPSPTPPPTPAASPHPQPSRTPYYSDNPNNTCPGCYPHWTPPPGDKPQ